MQQEQSSLWLSTQHFRGRFHTSGGKLSAIINQIAAAMIYGKWFAIKWPEHRLTSAGNWLIVSVLAGCYVGVTVAARRTQQTIYLTQRACQLHDRALAVGHIGLP